MSYNTYETTIEKLERAVSQLVECQYTRDQAIARLVHDLEESGDEYLAEYARANL